MCRCMGPNKWLYFFNFNHIWLVFSVKIFLLTIIKYWFLGVLAKFRKATISFFMSVCPSVWPHETTRLPLDGFWLNFKFGLFLRKTGKIKFFKSSKNNGTLHEDVFIHMTISRWILLRMRNILNIRCRESENTYFNMFSNFFPKILPFMR